MDLSEIRLLEQSVEIGRHLARGLAAFGVPDPATLEEWARKHFYLSAESSYVEQAWTPWPFQRAIMACISNDDIEEVDWLKAARVGNTKIMLAAIGYFAEHKRRNQAMWQPTDEDRDEFVKSELDPMLRDVKTMQRVFPQYLARHKDNTLQQKRFLGSVLYLRGGKAAKNYRRISVDVAYIDEADAFDGDVEKEGDPITLAAKRIEGATFPKLVVGSTPKLKGFSLVDERASIAAARMRFVVPCPECGDFHPIVWGGKDETTGFKWQRTEAGEALPETVRHLCPHCGALITQGQYLSVADRGFYLSEDGALTLDAAGVFRDQAGAAVPPPRHVAFVDVWTAYSPAASWPAIVRDFIAAHEKAQTGDNAKLKTFWNTTLGRAWEADVEKTDANELQARAEGFALRMVPAGGLLLLAGVDTQDNRLEAVVWAFGRGSEMWTVDHQVFFGNPAEDQVWADLEEFLFEREYQHASGYRMKIEAAAVDSGGHHSNAVYEFARRHAKRNVYAVRGVPGRERAIKHGAGPVDIDWRGRRRKNGVILWHVGTNLAKDLLYGRLQVTRPGAGYVHFSSDLSDEFFRQITGEARAERVGAGGRESRWTALRKRVEALDATVYVLWLEAHLELQRKSATWWDARSERIAPRQADLLVGIDPPQPVATIAHDPDPIEPEKVPPERDVAAPQATPTHRPANPLALALSMRRRRR